MDFELFNHFQQSQKLKLTHLMKRSFLILQMTAVELKDFLISQIEKNPILEIKEKPIDYYYNKKNTTSFLSIEKQKSLFEHLMLQAKEVFSKNEDLFIAENIIGNLDKKGYFSIDIDTFATELNVKKDLVLDVLKIIQTFDPKGIASQSLKQRILSQINENSILYKIVNSNFNDFLHKNFNHIANDLNLDLQTLKNIVKEESKNIKIDPTSSFLPQEPLDIYPDVIITKVNKKWVIDIQDDLPYFQVNKAYVNILENNKEGSSKKYLFTANILMKNILTRRKTLLDISTYIIKKQSSFILQKGLLQPMTIKDVAKELKLNPSTISRALQNKYMQCPLGLLPLKTFFMLSHKEKQNLRHFDSVLKEILIKENKTKPLSDIELTKKLQEKGFSLNRRTVCKYRKKLNISSTHQRKIKNL